jgi:uncharacterized protein
MAVSQRMEKVEAKPEIKIRPNPLKSKIWIDLDNSPHVPFFLPIIKELEARGYTVVLTARDAFQVKELLELHGLRCRCIGRHYGKRMLLKLIGVGIRTLQLLPTVLATRPNLAVAHGSRGQLALATAFRIPVLSLTDYEHAAGLPLFSPTWMLVPEVIFPRIHFRKDRVFCYPGIKEDVYVPNFTPDPAFPKQLGLRENEVMVTVRPPANEAHYHNPKSDELFHATMEFLGQNESVRVVLLPRNHRQADAIRREWPQFLASGKVVIPEHALDGLNLIWYSDLVVSGGGTMNREAAALGVPVYSIFRGKMGAVDQFLSDNGRLVMIERPEDLVAKVSLSRRVRPMAPDRRTRPALQAIVDNIVRLLDQA